MDDFQRFYEQSWPRLFRVLAPVTLDRGDAEDVLQEAYAAAARDWDRVQHLDSPTAWVRKVAVRALDLHRRGRRRRRAYRLLAPQEHHLDDLSLEVVDALGGLPVAERQVVVLHHLLGLTVEELSRELDRPSGTVKAQLVRGRRRLAVALRLEEEVRVDE